MDTHEIIAILAMIVIVYVIGVIVSLMIMDMLLEVYTGIILDWLKECIPYRLRPMAGCEEGIVDPLLPFKGGEHE